MTWFYVCINCGRIVGHGKDGKLGIEKIKCYGSCCYDMNNEINEINKQREERGLDKQDVLTA